MQNLKTNTMMFHLILCLLATTFSIISGCSKYPSINNTPNTNEKSCKPIIVSDSLYTTYVAENNPNGWYNIDDTITIIDSCIYFKTRGSGSLQDFSLVWDGIISVETNLTSSEANLFFYHYEPLGANKDIKWRENFFDLTPIIVQANGKNKIRLNIKTNDKHSYHTSIVF